MDADEMLISWIILLSFIRVSAPAIDRLWNQAGHRKAKTQLLLILLLGFFIRISSIRAAAILPGVRQPFKK